MGHHNQLSLYCHLLTETPSRNIWDSCFPQKSPSCHYSPAPAVLKKAPKIPKPETLQHPGDTRAPCTPRVCAHTSCGYFWSWFCRGKEVLHSPICYCCSHHLPSPFTPADFLNLTLFLHSSDKKLFPSNVLDTAGCVPLLFCNTELKQDGCHEEEKVFTSGQGFSPKENHHKMSCCCSILQHPACRGEPEWALCNTEPHFSSLETF